MIRASTRQLKLLRFFGVPVTEGLSQGAAGWEIAELMAAQRNRELWRRYIFVTGDAGADSPFPVEVEKTTLLASHVPDDFDDRAAVRDYVAAEAAAILQDGSPFDVPQPPVVFGQHVFMFTGKFEFGTRTKCEEAVVSLGGEVAPSGNVSDSLDYLVIGTKGSHAWSRGSYGTKIEAAVVQRRSSGTPAIVSEEHWLEAMRGHAG